MFNSNTWMILYYDTWAHVSMPLGIKKKFNKNVNIRFLGT
jgi:hypothetical protein